VKLIFIYGPPAVGKLTVAKELSKIINYKIFHNHLTVDLLLPFFFFYLKEFWKHNDNIRLEMFEIAARKNINLIFTGCYAKGLDDKNIRNIVKTIKKYKGEVYFVQLTTNKKELSKRVKENSRRKYRKVKSMRSLNQTLKKYDLFSSVPFKDNLKIDTTSLSARKTAQLIKKHYNLK